MTTSLAYVRVFLALRFAGGRLRAAVQAIIGVGVAAMALLLIVLLLPQAGSAHGVKWSDSAGSFQIAQVGVPTAGQGCGTAGTSAPASWWRDPGAGPEGIPNLANAGQGWFAPAQGYALNLFKALFVFEIFMIGIQAILFRDNIAHLFSTLAFKTFVVSFFTYLMYNGSSIFPQILNSFQIAGQTVGQSGTTVGSAPNSLYNIFLQTTNTAGMFFCAAFVSHLNDNTNGNANGNLQAGSGCVGCAITESLGHLTFEFFTQGLGMVVIAAVGIMFLSYLLLTAEMFIAMSAGVFFLGFSTMRFTLPFTQGYFSYIFNVGVKLFTFWVVIAIEQTFLIPQLGLNGLNLLDAANLPAASAGAGAEMYLVPATVSVVQILATAALTWFLPTIAGRFISGETGLSAAKAVSGLASALSGSPVMVGGPRNTMIGGSPVRSIGPDAAPLPPPLTKEHMSSTVHPAPTAPPFGMPLDPRMLPVIAPQAAPPPSSPAAFSVLASIDGMPTISGAYTPPVVSVPVGEGPPFFSRPAMPPIVINGLPGAQADAPAKAARPRLAGVPEEAPFAEDGVIEGQKAGAAPAATGEKRAPFKQGDSVSSPGFSAEQMRQKSAAAAGTTSQGTAGSARPAVVVSSISAAASAASLGAAPARPTARPQEVRAGQAAPVEASQVRAGAQAASVAAAAPPAGLNAAPARPTARPEDVRAGQAAPVEASQVRAGAQASSMAAAAAPPAGLNAAPARPTARPEDVRARQAAPVEASQVRAGAQAASMAAAAPPAGLNAAPARPTARPQDVRAGQAAPVEASQVRAGAQAASMEAAAPPAGLNAAPARPTARPQEARAEQAAPVEASQVRAGAQAASMEAAAPPAGLNAAPARPTARPQEARAEQAVPREKEADEEESPVSASHTPPAAAREAKRRQGRTLVGMTPEQIKKLSSEVFRELLTATPWDALTPEQLNVIDTDERLSSIANEVLAAAARPAAKPEEKETTISASQIRNIPTAVAPAVQQTFKPPIALNVAAARPRANATEKPEQRAAAVPTAASQEVSMAAAAFNAAAARPAAKSQEASAAAEPADKPDPEVAGIPAAAGEEEPDSLASLQAPAAVPSVQAAAPPASLNAAPARPTARPQEARAEQAQAAPKESSDKKETPSAALREEEADEEESPVSASRMPPAAAREARLREARTLVGMTPEEIKTLSSELFRALLTATPWDALTPEQLNVIDADERLSFIANEALAAATRPAAKPEEKETPISASQIRSIPIALNVAAARPGANAVEKPERKAVGVPATTSHETSAPAAALSAAEARPAATSDEVSSAPAKRMDGAAPSPAAVPGPADFRAALQRRWAAAGKNAQPSCEVQAGDLHHEVCGYREADALLTICRATMRQAMDGGDRVLEEADSAQGGANLLIRYLLPRGVGASLPAGGIAAASPRLQVEPQTTGAVPQTKEPAQSQTLEGLTPAQIKALPSDVFRRLLKGTPWGLLSAEQLDAIDADERLTVVATEVLTHFSAEGK